MKTGAELIAEERRRQMSDEGWTPTLDDNWIDGQLQRAAECYLKAPDISQVPNVIYPPGSWPWEDPAWKPKSRLANLVRAGALLQAERDRLKRIQDRIAAEIDRLQRQAPAAEGEGRV